MHDRSQWKGIRPYLVGRHSWHPWRTSLRAAFWAGAITFILVGGIQILLRWMLK